MASGVLVAVLVGGIVGVKVGVAVLVGVRSGVWVTVGVGHGLAMSVTARTKGACMPSSMRTRFSIGVSWAMTGLGPAMPKVIVTVAPVPTVPDQSRALFVAL